MIDGVVAVAPKVVRDKRGPLISILMTAYNPGQYLAQAVTSLLEQTFDDFELIIVDDGCTDGSAEVLKTFNDQRIRIICPDEHIGRTPALILALAEARGTYVAVQDADDISLPDRLKVQSDYLNTHPNCVLVGSYAARINAENIYIVSFEPLGNSSEEFVQHLSFENIIAHSSAMYRRDAAIAVGGYPKEYAYAQDFGLWVRLARAGDIFVLPEKLVTLRDHGQRMSVVDGYSITRSWDAIKIFREASSLPGLTDESRSRNRLAEAWECGRLAKIMINKRQLFRALRWGLRGFARSPLRFIEKMMTSAQMVSN